MPNVKCQDENSVVAWFGIDDMTPAGEKCFIPRHDTVENDGEGVNQKDGYIFGDGISGAGYYHITTKESYRIMLKRTDDKIRDKRDNIRYYSCWSRICPCGNYLTEKEKAQTDMKTLESAKNELTKRVSADAPVGIDGLPEEVTKYHPAAGAGVTVAECVVQ